MRRVLAAFAVVVVVASIATGVLIWRLTRGHRQELPAISAYSHGQLVRVGPYRYCEVLNPTKCAMYGSQGELAVTNRHPVQLSVPEAIAKAPWVLLREYEGGDTTGEFAPNSRLAVTIPTTDVHHGKLKGIAVMLPTLVRDEEGNEIPVPHAEWSVRTVWP
ncbi:MAG TPA: DUF2771 domain-containing protein [Mycobacterium sp.]|nr:DUF2771 domain-containing protein [Mycobacterium sp.]